MRLATGTRLAAAALAFAPGVARACPICVSATGDQVRAGIFGPGLGANLAATLLPFAVVLGVAGLIRFGPLFADDEGETADG